MKVKVGKIYEHLSFGITFTNYHHEYRAFIIDFAFWYVEFVFKEYINDKNTEN